MGKLKKPHHGRIAGWHKSACDGGLGYVIVGEFLDHPMFRGPMCHTSAVISHDETTGEIETRNSRYTLVESGEPSRVPGFPWKGDKMHFLGANGYEHELEAARKLFLTDQVYEVEDCDVGDWSHSIKFVGVEGRHNGVMFGPA